MTTTNQINYKTYIDKGIDYETYHNNHQHQITLGNAVTHAEYLPINLQRSERISKQLILLPELQNALNALESNCTWLVISEHWCGDAAQIVPVIAKVAAAANGKINLKIVYRDENLELIDAHLTGTSRSIPKLIQLNTNNEVVKTWGPRPNAAQEMVVKLKSNPETASSYAEELHKWYAQNKQKAIQEELLAFLVQ